MRGGVKQRGFSLLEMVMAMVVVALLAAISVPAIRTVQKKQRLREAGRSLVADMRAARTLSASGRSIDPLLSLPAPIPPPAPSPPLGPAPGPMPGPMMAMSLDRARVRRTYVRVDSSTSYSVVAVLTDGTDQIQRIVDYTAREPGTTLRIVEPPGTRIDFAQNGTRLPTSPEVLTVEDSATGERVAIEVNAGGRSRIR